MKTSAKSNTATPATLLTEPCKSVEDSGVAAGGVLPDIDGDLNKCILHRIPLNKCVPCWLQYCQYLGGLTVQRMLASGFKVVSGIARHVETT